MEPAQLWRRAHKAAGTPGLVATKNGFGRRCWSPTRILFDFLLNSEKRVAGFRFLRVMGQVLLSALELAAAVDEQQIDFFPRFVLLN